jgi:SAM-dependent methyltransferase
VARIVGSVARYYSARLETYGATPWGVDWNSEASQNVRFEQLQRVLEWGTPISIIDYGCGYGAMAMHLVENGGDFTYTGFDVSEEMINKARGLISDPRCMFTTRSADLQPADYTLASGIFNVRLDTPEPDWRAYIAVTIDAIAGYSRRGFAFNMLTRFADAHLMREDLFYADPMSYFALCKETYSSDVALLHDYELYEFTMLVRLGTAPTAFVPAA